MKRIKRQIRIALCLVLIICSVFSACVCSVSASGDKTVRVGVSGGMIPLIYIDEDGTPNGTYVEIMDAVAKSIGISVEYVVYSRQQQAVVALDSGELDLVLGVNAEDIKSYPNIRASAEIYSAEVCLVTSAVENGNSGYNPGIYELGTVSYSNASLTGANSMRIAATQDQVFSSLLSGESRIALAIKPCIQYNLEKNGLSEKFVIDNGYFYRTSYYVAVGRNNHALYNNLNSGIGKVRFSHEYEEIVEKWIVNTDLAAANVRIQRLIKVIGGGASVALLAVMTIVIFNLSLRAKVKEKTAELSEKIEDLQNSSELRNTLIERSSAGSMVINLDGTVLLVNDAMRRLAGIKEGEEIHTELDLPPAIRSIWEAAPSDMDAPELYVIRDAEGRRHTYRYQNHKTSNHDERVFMIEDVTTEEMEKQEVFEESKNKALNRIISGIAHEIKNPLMTIKTYASLAKSQGGDPEFMGAFTEYVPKEVDRITRLVETLVNYSRPVHGQKERFCVAEIADSCLGLAYVSAKKNIMIQNEIDRSCHISANKDQFRQALINFLINSIESNEAKAALNLGGPFLVRLSVYRVDSDVCIEVYDTGMGMNEEQLQQCAEPFFTTKKKGTGMGLALAKQYTKENGGRFEVESAEGKYTSVRMIFAEDTEND